MNEIMDDNITHNESVFNMSHDYIPYDKRPETYFVPVLFFLIFVVGVLGNGTLVVIFLRHRTMRNVPNTMKRATFLYILHLIKPSLLRQIPGHKTISAEKQFMIALWKMATPDSYRYILSLALGDLLVLITSVPFTSIIYTVESWPWGESICKLSETAQDISIGVSVFTLTALSADRFFAIVDPLKKFHTSGGGRKATRITLGIAVSIWLFAIVLAVPAAFGSHLLTLHYGHLEIKICYPFPKHWLNEKYPKVNVMAKFLILYVIPLSIIAVFYMNMANHLIVSTRNVPGETQGTQRQIRARKKVAITVLIFVLVFAVCFLPHHIFMLFFYFYPYAEDSFNAFWNYLRIVGFCLRYLNSCANPIALYWVSGAFRKHFNRYLLCVKPKRARCDTCQGNHGTSMSMASTKRSQPYCNRKGRPASINWKPGHLNGHETSITLLGNGNDHVCSKM